MRRPQSATFPPPEEEEMLVKIIVPFPPLRSPLFDQKRRELEPKDSSNFTGEFPVIHTTFSKLDQALLQPLVRQSSPAVT